MNKRLVVAASLLILVMVSTFPVSINAASVPVNGIIFSVDVSEMYIEDQPIPVQVQALYFQNSVPQTTAITIYATVTNVTSGQSFNFTFNVSSGVPQSIYLRSLPIGEYSFQAYAYAMGQSSKEASLEFLVSPPPVPYMASFVSGGLFSFHSDMLNRTGHYNTNYTFTLDVYYQYPGGTAELVSTYRNVTNLTLKFPDDGQIVVINIIDEYGWVNGMGLNPPAGIFSGAPYTYDFNIVNQEPFSSVYVANFIPDVIAVFFLALVMVLLVDRTRKSRRRP